MGEHLAFWQHHAPGTRLINEYGPTETVVGCCVYELPTGAAGARQCPLAPHRQYAALCARPASPARTNWGAWRTLHRRGGLARGYLHRPELTAEAFIPHPLSDEPGARLYKTGDLVRYLPDGNLEFLGRLDHQVKVLGYRIELGEVEVVLGQHPAMRQAVVLAGRMRRGHPLGGLRRPTAGAAPPSSALRSFLQQKLPSYMVPSALVFLDALPLTPNGKSRPPGTA